MNTKDANERKQLVEFGRPRGGGNEGGRRPRLPAAARSVLIFVISLAACGFLTWWLWARFRIRFYFIFIPFIGIGGPLMGRLSRRAGGVFNNGWRGSEPGGDAGGERRLLEDRRNEDGDGDDHAGDRNS